MTKNFDISELETIIERALSEAERHWENGGAQLSEGHIKANAMDMEALEQSKIPGHPLVGDNETVIEDFVAFVADMRDSSNHLTQSISSKIAKVSQLQRVYYETSALLPAVAYTVKAYDGAVTEYLGDGLLALFKVDPDKKSKSLYDSHNAGKKVVGEVLDIINSILNRRFSLPPIEVGVGLARSKALVTLVGLTGDKHPKAIGECVYRASKLSNGRNKVIIDEIMERSWPSSAGGKMRFTTIRLNNLTGYEATK